MYGPSNPKRWNICQMVHTSGQTINGEWRIAEFDDAPPKGTQGHTTGDNAGSQSDKSSKSDNRQSRSGRHSIQDYYDILGLNMDADIEAVRHAFRQLALRSHPDLHTSPEAHEHMQQLNVAYAKIMAQFD